MYVPYEPLVPHMHLIKVGCAFHSKIGLTNEILQYAMWEEAVSGNIATGDQTKNDSCIPNASVLRIQNYSSYGGCV